jgi:predicted GNAT family acetyltransferase
VYLAGVAVLEAARRRGIAAAMSAWLLERGFADGARLAHLHADTDTAARVYSRLGFAPAGELDIYVDL